MAAGFAVSAVVLFASFVYCQIEISQAAFARVDMESRAAAEAARIELLRSNVAELESPARLIAEARRLGLVVPVNVQFLHVAGSASPRGR